MQQGKWQVRHTRADNPTNTRIKHSRTTYKLLIHVAERRVIASMLGKKRLDKHGVCLEVVLRVERVVWGGKQPGVPLQRPGNREQARRD
jgi:hypothetical protein